MERGTPPAPNLDMKVATPHDLIDIQALRIGMFVHLDVGWMSHPFPLSSFKIKSAEQILTIRTLGLKRVRWSPQLSDFRPPMATRAALAGVRPAMAPNAATPTAGALGNAASLDAQAASPAPAKVDSAAGEASIAAAAGAEPAATASAPTSAPTSVGVPESMLGADTPRPTTGAASAAAAVAPADEVPTTSAMVTASLATSGTVSAASASADHAALAAAATAQNLAMQAREEHRARLAQQRSSQKLCEKQFTEAARACRQATELLGMRPQEARAQTEALTKALLDKMLGDGDVCVRLLTESAGDKASAHGLTVSIISLLMGRCFGFSEADLLDLGVGALLHDMGKTDVPSRLRHREESFQPHELRAYEEHVANGVAAAQRMGLSPGATAVIAQHHEHVDGSGFPNQLNAERMTIGARIVALVNRYDNLCNPYVTGRALTPHEAVSLLFAQGKSKFDTSIMGAFIKMMGVYPPGSTVQLTDDRYALVMSVNSSRPLKPSVLLFEPSVPREDALVIDLESTSGLGIRRSLKPMQLPAHALSYLAPAQRLAYFFEPINRALEEA